MDYRDEVKASGWSVYSPSRLTIVSAELILGPPHRVEWQLQNEDGSSAGTFVQPVIGRLHRNLD